MLPESSPPFPYLNHGALLLDAVGKSSGAYIAFRDPVPRARRAVIMRGCPSPIAGFQAWGSTLMSTETGGDTFDYELAERYAGNDDPQSLTAEALADFARDVERWAHAVHALHPILFFIGPVCTAEASPLGQRSREMFPSIMIPFLERYAEAHADELSADDDTDDFTMRRFDQTAMSCLLQHIPETEDADLTGRAALLRERFPL